MNCKLKKYPSVNEQVYYGKLPNGLSVYVNPKLGYHKTFAVFAAGYGGADHCFTLGGSRAGTPMGVAHFLEHLMFETPEGSAFTKLSSNGASANAYTSSDITAYYFESVDMFRENLEILLNFVSLPYFTGDSVEREQGIISQEILMCEDDPDFCLYYGLMESLFKHNPLRNSVAGTTESIAEITAGTLYDCHKVFYHPSNMVLCVAGDVNPTDIFDIAIHNLPDTQAEPPQRDYGPPEALSPVSHTFTKSMDISLPIFLAGCKSEPVLHGQASLKLDLISAISLDLLAGHSSPLYLRLYDEGLVSSDFSASYDCAVGAAYSAFGGETRDPGRVFDEVKKEIARLSDQGPDPLFFNRIKKAAQGSYIRSLNSPEAICGNLIEGHFRSYDALETMDTLFSITESDITDFYRSHLSPENMAISIITPNH